jgi:hypothetical protein
VKLEKEKKMGIIQSGHRDKVTKQIDTFSPQYTTILQPVSPHVNYYLFPVKNVSLPSRVDLREPGGGCYPYPPIFDQSLLDNCSSAAVIGGYQCTQRKQKPGGTSYPIPSALYNYYYARTLTGNTTMNSGTSVEASLDAMLLGVAEETYWPYHPDKVHTTPDVEAQINALSHSIVQYDRLLPTLDNLKRTLASGYSFLFTFAITKSMDQWFRDRNLQVKSNFLLPIVPFAQSDLVGAHTVLVVGYDDKYLSVGGFVCRNSWGSQWGQEGHFWFPYSSTIYPDLSTSFFIIQKICDSVVPNCVSSLDCRGVYSDTVCSNIIH